MNKQSEIKKYLSKVKTATLEELVNGVPFGYFNNQKKHMGEELAKMIKKRIVKRTERGVYELCNVDDSEQQKLF